LDYFWCIKYQHIYIYIKNKKRKRKKDSWLAGTGGEDFGLARAWTHGAAGESAQTAHDEGNSAGGRREHGPTRQREGECQRR
jgi:hypothetical protein